MKPQTKRSFCLGAFLVIVTLVVLYSYCNGSSVCYTFPLFNGLERDSLQAKPPAEMVVTSVIVQTKQPFDMGTIQKNQGTNKEKPMKLNELHTTTAHEVEQNKATNFSGIAEKLHFHRNRTSFETYLFGHVEEKDNKTQPKEPQEITKHLLPPSDIVGKVAEEILRKANISEEEANRELIRVEKVDGFVDREKEHGKRLNQHEHSLLEKVKESRSAGGKSSERKLVRVERVDLTDEDEEEDRQPEKPFKPAYERSQAQEGAASSRLKPMGISEDSELAHARRFGKIVAVNTTLNTDVSAGKQEENRFNSGVNKTKEASAVTPPPFFAKFLNVTAQEREMMDFLHNYTENSKALQENVTVREDNKMAQRFDMPSAQAHADKVNVRGKRNHKEDDLHNTLQPLIAKLLNLTNNKQAGSENLEEPFNLSNILGKITEGNHDVVAKDQQTSVPDSTALLVRFLQQGSRYRPHMPQNDTAVHADKDEDQIADSNKLQSPSEGAINLKETLLQLANHIDLSRHHNDSKSISDNREKSADLMMLKLLLNQSTLQDISAFNLSRVLKEITGNSLQSSLKALEPIKVKRDEDGDDLGSTSAQSDLKIFRPVSDKLGTSKSELVFNTEIKPSNALKKEADLASANESSNTTNLQHLSTRNDNASFSSGSGSGESGDGESRKRFV